MRVYPLHKVLLLVLVLLAACERVTNDAPTALEPQALILTVTSEGDSGPGTLRRAIELADSGSTITFADNVRTVTLTTSELSIDKSLTIIGQGRVTISGGGTVRVIRVGINVTLNLDGMTIANGLAAQGGGINNFGTLTVTNSTFSGNRTTGFNAGGAIFNGFTLTVTNSTFSGNSAEEGGGISNYGTAATVTNSTFSGNSARLGGGIFNYRNITITNSTFSGNSAQSTGGGIYNSGRFNLTNSIVALNTAPRGPELDETINNADVVTLSHNLIGNPANSGITDGVNGNIVNDDPKLGTLADNGGPTQTLALLADSPAIDKADSYRCPPRDQRGVTRPQGSGCDIGAFERVPDPEPEPITVTLSANSSGTVSRATGAATVSGTVNCSTASSVRLNVTVSQAQKQGKTTSTVTGSNSATVQCNGTTPWTATVNATSGAFKNGSATVTVEQLGSSPLNQVAQAVTLGWVR